MTESVADARDERRLGPDHREIDLERGGELEQPVDVVGPHRVARASRGDPGIPRCGVQLVSASRASRQARACSRPPEPTINTRTLRV